MNVNNYRDTQDTLAVIEALDLDGDPPTQEEIAKKVRDYFIFLYYLLMSFSLDGKMIIILVLLLDGNK